MDGKRLKRLASDFGLKERPLYRAAQAIGVTMLPGGFGKPRRWHLCPMSATGCHVYLTKTNGEQAKGGRHEEPAAVAKAEPENKIKAARSTAKLAIHPGVNAALVIKEFAEVFGGLDAVEVGQLAARLKDGMNDNDLRRCEAMLYCQAHALQAIFVDAVLQVPKQGWFSTSEAYMRMAMKAQNQCRMTLETLAQIKDPSAVFARQANITQGPQQVNNAIPAGDPLARGKNKNTPNKLLEEEPRERLDT